MRNQEGFTLVELMIGMVIITLLIGAIGSALVVSLNTTNATNQRMSENHDVQITSSYLANDVQSAASVTVGSGVDCSGAFTTLVTFTYWAPGNPPTPNGPPAVYKCGTVAGETQVTRTFKGATVIVAHFAGATRPEGPVAHPSGMWCCCPPEPRVRSGFREAARMVAPTRRQTVSLTP